MLISKTKLATLILVAGLSVAAVGCGKESVNPTKGLVGKPQLTLAVDSSGHSGDEDGPKFPPHH